MCIVTMLLLVFVFNLTYQAEEEVDQFLQGEHIFVEYAEVRVCMLYHH